MNQIPSYVTKIITETCLERVGRACDCGERFGLWIQNNPDLIGVEDPLLEILDSLRIKNNREGLSEGDFDSAYAEIKNILK